MRAAKTIELDPGRMVTVQELRVRDMRQLLPMLSDPEMQSKQLPEMIQAHFPDLMRLIGESVILPQDVTLDDLSLSECEVIGKAWWELHSRFFLQAIGLAGAGLASVSATTSTGLA